MPKCKGCGAEVRWITTAKGKPMICESELVDINSLEPGERIVSLSGLVLTRPLTYTGGSTRGYRPHWGRCPQASIFRKKTTEAA